MQATQNGSAPGKAPSAEPSASASAELDKLRVTCRRQAHVIDTLTGEVMTLRDGAAALQAENAALRVDNDRLHGRRRERRKVASDAEPVEVRLLLDVHAPAAARAAVSGALSDGVSAAVLGRA